ncbi:hypothetical protein Taro_001173 [Colocasia esculenta]|uniref:Uncharacterized protein n=1 Tax=Colocasia esculenta TaxID=4460 RepID=A0A843T990_COLES|nr:hypothetical protein [Colocasia esculenta]
MVSGKNPEIATWAYKDGDRAVRPGVRSRQGLTRKATGLSGSDSGSMIATKRLVAIGSRRFGLSRRDLKT